MGGGATVGGNCGHDWAEHVGATSPATVQTGADLPSTHRHTHAAFATPAMDSSNTATNGFASFMVGPTFDRRCALASTARRGIKRRSDKGTGNSHESLEKNRPPYNRGLKAL